MNAGVRVGLRSCVTDASPSSIGPHSSVCYLAGVRNGGIVADFLEKRENSFDRWLVVAGASAWIRWQPDSWLAECSALLGHSENADRVAHGCDEGRWQGGR